MRGFAVIVVRDDGSHFFSIGDPGFACTVWFHHSQALEYARELREHRMNAQVVKVEYSDPVIVGPKRFLATQADVPEAPLADVLKDLDHICAHGDAGSQETAHDARDKLRALTRPR